MTRNTSVDSHLSYIWYFWCSSSIFSCPLNCSFSTITYSKIFKRKIHILFSLCANGDYFITIWIAYRVSKTFFNSRHFVNAHNWPALFLLLFTQHCAYFYRALFLFSLADSPSSHPSSLHLPDSLSSGSIKSLLICSFLLIWIHTGPNCWLGSAKETRLNEVYKTHNWSLRLCVVFFLYVHACLWAPSHTFVCACAFHRLLF